MTAVQNQGPSRVTPACGLPFTRIESASSMLDDYLDSIFRPVNRPDATAINGTHSLQEWREEMDKLHQDVESIELRMAALCHSLETAKRARKELQNRRKTALSKANELVLAKGMTIQFPTEILCLICSYTYPLPLETPHLWALTDRGLWGRIVLQTARLRLRCGGHRSDTLSALASALPTSAPASLSIQIKSLESTNLDILRLSLGYQQRWRELTVKPRMTEDACRKLRLELMSEYLRRITLRKPSRSLNYREDDIENLALASRVRLPYVDTLSTTTKHVSCLSGQLPNLVHLFLSVDSIYSLQSDLNIALKDTPHIKTMSITWNQSQFPLSLSLPPKIRLAPLPNLSNLILKFYYCPPTLGELQLILESIDTRRVRRLQIHCLGARDEGDSDLRTLLYLGQKLPLLNCLSLRRPYLTTPYCNSLVFRNQREILDKLASSSVFPSLKRLSIEMDYFKEGLFAITNLLKCRALNPSASSLHFLDLHTRRTSDAIRELRTSDPLDYFNEVQMYIQNFTVQVDPRDDH